MDTSVLVGKPIQSRLTAAVSAILPPIGAVVAFYPVLSSGFVDWDDLDNFTNNFAYRGLGWHQLRWDWTTFHLEVYQPLAWMAFSLQYAIWGLDPRGYHLA